MKKLTFALLVLMLMWTSPVWGQGGPVVLMGIDAEDCGPGGHGPITTYRSVVNSILTAVTKSGTTTDILVVGGGSCVTSFWNALKNLSPVLSLSFVSGSAISTVSFSPYDMIAVASDQFNTSGGLSDADNNLLAARASDIANHVNNGGGLLGFSNCALTNKYGYLGGLGSFTCGSISYSDITPTPAGTAIGITNSLDVCCWHDVYTSFPSFLGVLATRTGSSQAAAIGGVQVVIPGFVLSPATDTNPTGTTHTVTITVTQTVNNVTSPVANVTVTFTVSGANTATGSCVTGSNGQCTFTYTGTNAGTDTITANGTVAGQAKTATASKIWQVVNQPPNAQCQDVTVTTDPGVCDAASASVDAGSYDPDGQIVSSVQAPAGPYQLGATSPVTLTVTDNNGASASCTATVTVVDQELPAILCPAAQVVECTGNGGANVTVGPPTASDNCSVTSSCTLASGSYPLGTTTGTCTATDGSGNSSTCGTSVTVQDTIAPTVSCVESVNPSGKNVPKASNTNQDGFYKVGASDVCSAPVIKIGSFTLANGETIKITQTPGKSGVSYVNTMGPEQIRHFQVGPGDAVITATDGSGNQTSVTCLVPPPPK